MFEKNRVWIFVEYATRRYLLINQNIDATEIYASRIKKSSNSTSLKADFYDKKKFVLRFPLALASSRRYLPRRTGGFSITPSVGNPFRWEPGTRESSLQREESKSSPLTMTMTPSRQSSKCRSRPIFTRRIEITGKKGGHAKKESSLAVVGHRFSI